MGSNLLTEPAIIDFHQPLFTVQFHLVAAADHDLAKDVRRFNLFIPLVSAICSFFGVLEVKDHGSKTGTILMAVWGGLKREQLTPEHINTQGDPLLPSGLARGCV
jgi:hypothetical protein